MTRVQLGQGLPKIESHIRRQEVTPPSIKPKSSKGADAGPSKLDGAKGDFRLLRGKYDTHILLVASILAIIPLWLSVYPQMVDLPQHAAQVSMLRSLQRPGFAYQDLFRLNWFTPYLLGYLLVYFLSSFLGIITACKIIISLSLATVPISTALLMKEIGADEYWAALTIPGFYGFAYQWGFLNFLVAVPIGILFFRYAIRYSRQPSLKSVIWMAVLFNCVFFCHAMICAFFGLLSGLYILNETRSLKKTALRVAPMAAVVPTIMLWAARTMSHPGAKRPMIWDLGWFNTIEGYYYFLASWTTHTNPGLGRLTGFFPRLLGERPHLLYTLFGLTLFSLPLLAGARFSKRLGAWIPAIVCALTLLFVPHNIFGTDFTFQRFTVFALPFYVLVLLSPSSAGGSRKFRLYQLLALGLVLAWIAHVSVRVLTFAAATKGFNEIVARMEPGQRALSMIFLRDDDVSIAPVLLHFPSWYAAEKGGVADPSAAMMHPELVVYRPEKLPKAVLWDFEWQPAEFKWSRYDGQSYRYFVARAPVDISPYFFRDATCRVELRYAENGWWLYEKDPSCPQMQPSPGR